ncbi:MAG: branched-chain amino acid transport system ATP-binding protein [Chloroflexota bacterium]|nr:branched-chain amino acid transport system ATP-binding protein [Chloroflexota bacterium]
MMLDVEKINVYYGAIHALTDISFKVNEGEIVALIGANGAGKSTSLKTLSGILHPADGSIRFLEEEISTKNAEDIVRKGIVHVPEGRKIFAPLTVMENLEMGAYLQNDKNQIIHDIQSAFERFPRLKERQNQLGGTLSGGEQQMLAIARGLMARPKLMLLDEPSMGLAPVLVEQIFEIIQEINKQGTSILLVEQNAKMALSIANRAYVLETGNVVLEGNAKEVMENSSVIQAYLGG